MFNNHLPIKHLRAFTILSLESCVLSLVSHFLYNCRGISTNRPIFMQNKPNFPDAQMNLSPNITKDYENGSNTTLGENKPNSNPIRQEPKINVNSVATKDYQNIYPYGAPRNKAKTNPICEKARSERNRLFHKALRKSAPRSVPKNKPKQTQCQNRQNKHDPAPICCKTRGN